MNINNLYPDNLNDVTLTVPICKDKMKKVQRNPIWANFNDYDDIIMTVRILIRGQEVENIIGIGGETLNSIRDQSGTRILMNDDSTPERIFAITGFIKNIYNAIELIVLKIKEYFQKLTCFGNWNSPEIPLTLKLIVPESQCGYIIGKGGYRISEIRNLSGSIIHIGTENLPNSNERLISICGTTNAISKCVYQLCKVLSSASPLRATLPYDPNNQTSGIATTSVIFDNDFGRQHNNTLTGLTNHGLGTTSTGDINSGALAGSQLRTNDHQNQNNDGDKKNENENLTTKKIYKDFKNNDLSGYVTGSEGSKAVDIRRELPKTNLKWANSSFSPDDGSISTLPTSPKVVKSPLITIPQTRLIAKPDANNSHSSLTALNGITDFLGTLSSTNQSALIQTMDIHSPKKYLKRNHSTSGDKNKADKNKADKNKFAPY